MKHMYQLAFAVPTPIPKLEQPFVWLMSPATWQLGQSLAGQFFWALLWAPPTEFSCMALRSLFWRLAGSWL